MAEWLNGWFANQPFNHSTIQPFIKKILNNMETIRQGSKGSQVERWQFFLVGLGYTFIKADGDFGAKTQRATVDFQEKNGLGADGIVGEKTYIKAFYKGYNHKEAFEYPGKPDFSPLVGNKSRAKIFGSFRYKSVGPDSDDIIILDDWASKNIRAVEIPQLKGIKGAPLSGKIAFHRLADEQLANLFKEWEEAGLMNLVLTWAGSFVPRYVRGRRGVLSNHSFGSAFDINPEWNGLGRVPAIVGQKGSIRELVKIANRNGFYWGGHFSRLDGMHFEVAIIK